MTTPHPSPILVDRAAYLRMADAAARAARNPVELPQLIEAIQQVLKVARKHQEWTEEDNVRLATIGEKLPWGTMLFGDAAGYYRLHPNSPNPPIEGVPPRRTLWRGSEGQWDLVVVDQSPISQEFVQKLVGIGVLWPRPIHLWQQCPLQAFAFQERNHINDPNWTAISNSEWKFDGSWLVTGSGEAVAWVPFPQDATYLADCVNAVKRLERDVDRYPGGTHPAFPARVRSEGIVGLVRALRRAIHPQEWFEKPTPPQELVAQGQRLESDLVKFLSDIVPYRAGQHADATRSSE